MSGARQVLCRLGKAPVLLGALAAIVGAFPAAGLVALVYGFPIPFAGKTRGLDAVLPSMFAVLFFGVLGGFPVLASLGALAGYTAKALSNGSTRRGYKLAMLFGLSTSLGCSVVLAGWEDLRVWSDRFSERYRVGDTIEEENRLGRRLLATSGYAGVSYPGSDDEAVAHAVQQVGARLASHVRRRGIAYEFIYVPGFMFTAAAFPGGPVLVNKDLLRVFETEDELAAVLGHLIAHIDEGDGLRRVREIGLRELERREHNAAFQFSAYASVEEERVIDRASLAMMVAAGYSPAGALTVARRFHGQRYPTSPSLVTYVSWHMRAPLFADPERIAVEITARGWNAHAPQRPLAIRAVLGRPD